MSLCLLSTGTCTLSKKKKKNVTKYTEISIKSVLNFNFIFCLWIKFSLPDCIKYLKKKMTKNKKQGSFSYLTFFVLSKACRDQTRLISEIKSIQYFLGLHIFIPRRAYLYLQRWRISNLFCNNKPAFPIHVSRLEIA